MFVPFCTVEENVTLDELRRRFAWLGDVYASDPVIFSLSSMPRHRTREPLNVALWFPRNRPPFLARFHLFLLEFHPLLACTLALTQFLLFFFVLFSFQSIPFICPFICGVGRLLWLGVSALFSGKGACRISIASRVCLSFSLFSRTRD